MHRSAGARARAHARAHSHSAQAHNRTCTRGGHAFCDSQRKRFACPRTPQHHIHLTLYTRTSYPTPCFERLADSHRICGGNALTPPQTITAVFATRSHDGLARKEVHRRSAHALPHPRSASRQGNAAVGLRPSGSLPNLTIGSIRQRHACASLLDRMLVERSRAH